MSWQDIREHYQERDDDEPIYLWLCPECGWRGESFHDLPTACPECCTLLVPRCGECNGEADLPGVCSECRDMIQAADAEFEDSPPY